ncbi:hypothetical protein [Actinomyces gaoshouyii]|uniref:hypothetical protein n=1 Tax=Actinomyces gaoshouyii TaxID=1960083 RepID=UPI0009BF9669|nr:hypothetical protein [Actinomyces gaoshouyii]ARD42531.1 hypothetical protein B6G06_09390 [Actinomyces gaoshouyii]
MDKTNPLLRTPGREARRHAPAILGAVVAAIALMVVLIVASRVGGARTPSPDEPTVTTATPADVVVTDQTASPTVDASGSAAASRSLSVQCKSECTLVLTAAGDADVELTVDGPLTHARLLATDPTSTRMQVVGTGTIQVTASAARQVDLTVADESR